MNTLKLLGLCAWLASSGGAALASAAECETIWNGWGPDREKDLYVALNLQGHASGDQYDLALLSDLAYNQLKGGCGAQFQSLPAQYNTPKTFMSYFLSMNPGLMPARSNGRVQRDAAIPRTQLQAVMAAGGVRIAPQTVRTSVSTTSTQAASQPASSPVVHRPNHNVVPGCPSCSTGGHS